MSPHRPAPRAALPEGLTEARRSEEDPFPSSAGDVGRPRRRESSAKRR